MSRQTSNDNRADGRAHNAGRREYEPKLNRTTSNLNCSFDLPIAHQPSQCWPYVLSFGGVSECMETERESVGSDGQWQLKCSSTRMNVTVKTKIRYKGQEYSSADELPAEARSAYEHALANGFGATKNSGVNTRLVFNGQQFSSADELPSAERKLYDDAMQVVRDGGNQTVTPAPDTGWLTKGQLKVIMAVAGAVLALALVMAARSLL